MLPNWSLAVKIEIKNYPQENQDLNSLIKIPEKGIVIKHRRK